MGSLREELRPLDIVVPDQLFDRTKARPSTFFGDGVVVHVGFADPFCAYVEQARRGAGREAGATVHEGGTYVCIEGPQFSTRAESRVYRQLGFDIIGMTNLQEAKLAREAELCYATHGPRDRLRLWHESEEDVTLEQVLANMRRNVETAQAIVESVIVRPSTASATARVGTPSSTPSSRRPSSFPQATKDKLDLLIGNYLC